VGKFKSQLGCQRADDWDGVCSGHSLGGLSPLTRLLQMPSGQFQNCIEML
jgi:hypothetical protein